MSVVNVVLRMWFAVVLALAQFVLQPSQLMPEPSLSQPTPQHAPLAPAQYQPLRISQVYGGGDTSDYLYSCDYVELFNASTQAVSLNGWSVQYRLITDTRWKIIELGDKAIAAHSYFLVAGQCKIKPSFPYDWYEIIAIDAVKGKVALASKQTAISGLTDPAVVDFVGYGAAADVYEGSGPTPNLSTKTAAIRKDGGCTDTDDNAADFDVGWIGPHNSTSPAHTCPDIAPAVLSVSPPNGATDVPLNTNIILGFSEAVTVSENWFTVACDLSGVRDTTSAAVTGSGATYTIDPATDFYGDDACTLTVHAAGVSDTDGSPNPLSADHVVHFKTAPGQCGDPVYPIESIQGAGASSPVVGQQRTVEGIVTGDFQGAAGLPGYFLQAEPGRSDADPQTSEALFVDEHAGTLGDVAAGAHIRVTGVVTESAGLTSLGNASRQFDCGPAELPPPAAVSLPLPSSATWEQYEGMLVQFGQPLTVADSSGLSSEGTLRLVVGSLPQTFTQAHAPDAAGYAAWEADLAARTVLLDDGSALAHPDPIRYPSPGLSASNPVRAGDVASAGLTGIIDFRGGANRIQPVSEPLLQPAAPRPASPAPRAGNIRVAFMSLGDYFNTTDASGRGASSAEELARQRDKLTAALVGLNADVIGVSKVQNNGYESTSAIADLVNGLNAKTGAADYVFVNGGAVGWGSDAVAVGIIYRAAAVVPIGAPALRADGPFDQTTGAPTHRAPMAQTFEEKEWGERFTVVVNEWHGRGDCPAGGADADAGDGQACWNAARTAAANDLVSWLAADPTESHDPDVLALGELNAYPAEAPIGSFRAAQYADLIAQYVGPEAITTLADGRAGVSNHALASSSLAPQVVSASIWNINAEEPSALDYQLENKSESQRTLLYAPDPYRSANQNPVIVDFNLLADQSDLGGSYGAAWHTGQGTWRLGAAWGGTDDGVIPATNDWNDKQGEITVTVNGPEGQFACLYGWLDYSDGEVEPGVEDEADGEWNANEEVLAGMPLSSGLDQRITFPLPGDTLQAGAALNMRVRLVPAPDPTVASCTAGSNAAPQIAGLAPTGRADGGEVEDIAVTVNPLAVNTASFVAHQSGDSIVIAWETTSEADVAGFNLYRQAKGESAWRTLNAAPIMSQTPGASLGHAYRWIDADATPGDSYVYRLEEVGLHGASTFYGPVSATLAVPTSVSVTALHAEGVAWTAGRWLLALLAVAALLLIVSR